MSRSVHRTTSQASGSVYGSWYLSKLWLLSVELGVGAPLERPSYVYQRPGLPDEQVFRAAFATGIAAFSGGVNF